MSIELTSAQRQQLFEAVVGAYPSKASLAQAVYYEFGTNPNVISSGDTLQAFALDIVSWAEVNGRTEELVKAVRRANPSNEPLLKFEKTLYSGVQSKSLTRSVQPGPPTSSPSTPKLPTRPAQHTGRSAAARAGHGQLPDAQRDTDRHPLPIGTGSRAE